MNAIRQWWNGWLHRRTTTWQLSRGGKWAVGYEVRTHSYIRLAIPVRTVRLVVQRVAD